MHWRAPRHTSHLEHARRAAVLAGHDGEGEEDEAKNSENGVSCQRGLRLQLVNVHLPLGRRQQLAKRCQRAPDVMRSICCTRRARVNSVQDGVDGTCASIGRAQVDGLLRVVGGRDSGGVHARSIGSICAHHLSHGSHQISRIDDDGREGVQSAAEFPNAISKTAHVRYAAQDECNVDDSKEEESAGCAACFPQPAARALVVDAVALAAAPAASARAAAASVGNAIEEEGQDGEGDDASCRNERDRWMHDARGDGACGRIAGPYASH